VPAAHPYSVEVGCCLFDRLEEVVVGPENAGGLCGPHPAITLTRRRISLLSLVRRRRRRGFPASVFYVQRQMPGIWHPLA
jgi:hypothetical protein